MEPPPLDPEDLARVRVREPEALARFYERYFDLVYGLAARLLGERAAAEDVTQEVFVKVHRAAHTLDAARDPAPWLTTVVVNTCRDVWRSAAYRMRVRSRSVEHDPAVAGALTTGRDDPAADALAAERERVVQQALMELPEELRTLIVLHDYQGLDHLAIAERLGIAHAAARKRYSRALATLGRMLRERLS